MKVKLFLVLTIALLSSCQFTQKQKAEHLVKIYLDSTLNDPSSYTSVNFDSVYVLHATVYNNPAYLAITDSLIKITLDMKTDSDNLNYSFTDHYKIHAKLKLDSSLLSLYNKQSNNIENSFKPYDYGYAIKHTYRAKNGFGAIGLHEGIFIFDKKFTKVVNYSGN